jgi:hypothetical protein
VYPTLKLKTYAAVDAKSSALLAFVNSWTEHANIAVNAQISPSLTSLFLTTYNVTIDTMSKTVAKTMLMIATARLIFLIENLAIDSSTCKSYLV